MTDVAPRRLPLLAATPKAEEHHRTKGLLRVTMACNERCPFCNVPVEDYPRATAPMSELDAELDAFIASGERTLTLSGGEPTLYEDRVLSLTRRARAAGVPFVELQTNAVLIDAGYARRMAEAGVTSAFVSLLSDQAPLHDLLAGLDGAFARCLSGIDALLDAGIAVTLNPVIARQTQDRVAAYVDFVAERLPRVRVISLSAVQPHGRAAKDRELLPDYAVLARDVPIARQRAREHGLELLNPYCGLPLCVGWQDDAARSVEAIEAAAARGARGAHRAHGIDNRGNKRHGAPCTGCALRTRCGGAWHAYWDLRGGSGLAPIGARVEPWLPGAAHADGQSVVSAEGGAATAIDALRAATTPTVWLTTDRLRTGDAARIAHAGCTDLMLMTTVASLETDAETRAELSAIRRDNAELEPQARLQVVLGLRALSSFARAHALLVPLRDELSAVRLLVHGDERHRRFAAAARSELGLDVTLAELA